MRCTLQTATTAQRRPPRVAKLRERAGTSGLFLTGISSDNELQVMAYNRVINDLNGLDADQFMAAVGLDFQISETDTALPPARDNSQCTSTVPGSCSAQGRESFRKMWLVG